ncbi:MAG: MBL fold metallo-hydrolase [Firmicutes bacterium]|nr:hypothetical protein [Dethiobacter sp.]MBS3888121.1 MBL fold metallo-hydrolase [Bacillota bacterium]
MTKNPTHMRFWSGLKSIGGTVISLESGCHRLVFDFGLSYSPGEAVLDGQVRTRPSSLVADYLRLNMIPPLDGIYSRAALGTFSALPAAEESPWQTAVLISHLHLDHMGAMGLVHPEVPVYLTQDSWRLYHALSEIGEGVPQARAYTPCEYDRPFKHGPFVITPLAVDHDIPGACSFHIETPGGSILYTGDFRLHGGRAEVARTWLEKAKTLGVDILISEGTTLRAQEEGETAPLLGDSTLPETLATEAHLPEKMHTIINSTPGLAVFNLYHRNLTRLSTMLDVGKMNNRQTVLEPETAYMAKELLHRDDFSVYIGENTQALLQGGACPAWKSNILAQFPHVTAALIRSNPEQYFVQNSYVNCLELLDLMEIGGCYIHSNGMPLGPFDPAHPRLKKLLERVGLSYHYAGTSGHALPQHLQYACDTIAPKVLVPLHSFNPGRLQANHGRQLLPELDIYYRIENGDLLPL